MDIGDTLIGMHLRDVAVPVRLRTGQIGDAQWYAPVPDRNLSAVAGQSMTKN